MKKLILAIAMTAAATAFSKTTMRVGTNEVDAVQYITQYASSTNNLDKSRIPIVWDDYTKIDKDVMSRCDEILANAGYYNRFWDAWRFQKTTQNYSNTDEFKQLSDETKSKWAELVEMQIATGGTMNRSQLFNYQCFAYVISMYSQVKSKSSIDDLTKKNVLRLSETAAKRYLRKQGKSFVDKDGAFPVKTLVDAVVAALNAPKYSGLDAALKNIGMDYGFKIEPAFTLTDTQISELESCILDGIVNLDWKTTNILKGYLGVDGYNAFVREYNGN